MSTTTPPPTSIHPGCAEATAALAAYALGALDHGEHRAVSVHLAGCPACQADLGRHERTVAALDVALAPAPPAASLRPRLLAEIAGSASPARVPFPRPTARDASWWRRTAVALAAVAALLLAGVGVAGGLLLQARSVNEDAAGDRRQIAAYLSHGGIMTVLTPAPGASGGSRGTLIVAPNQPQALIVAAGLEPPRAGQRYRVWVEGGGQRTWLDALEVSADGSGYLLVSAPAPLETYDTVGLALETPGRPTRDTLTAPIRPGAGR
jgi:anti-sigma factor RsiW